MAFRYTNYHISLTTNQHSILKYLQKCSLLV
ncbi:hypothetical protein HR057_13785 [Bacillus sp. P2(2020)]|uniref:Uncharacterized protein n=1 Tax=Calidifontibacillus erzurumensis TaxID=2741433 RepID=A0A8J8KDA4_9BACI|nr:hypothetical protein [Calidifontibacillus erzurumensis]